MKIIHEYKKCIGCGACAVVCPKFWETRKDGKAHLLGSEFNERKDIKVLKIDKAECNLEAADVCPVQCIHILQET